MEPTPLGQRNKGIQWNKHSLSRNGARTTGYPQTKQGISTQYLQNLKWITDHAATLNLSNI